MPEFGAATLKDGPKMTQEAPKERVLNELRKRLREKQYEDGRLPPERELASVLSASRRAVRDALAKLEGEGIVWRRQGQGTFTEAPPTLGYDDIARLAHRVNPLEIVETRLAIEPMLAHRSALRASLADIEAMKRIAERALHAKNPTTTRARRGLSSQDRRNGRKRAVAGDVRNGPSGPRKGRLGTGAPLLLPT